MSKEQERARSRRRYEERAAAAKPPKSEQTRDKQLAAGILAAILVLALALGVPALLNRNPAPTAASGSGSSGVAQSGAVIGALEPGQKVLSGCLPPPALQTEPKVYTTVPSKAAAVGKTFIAKVTTTCGTIEIELDGAKAPQTVASFMQLAKDGYWAPSPCHRLTTEGLFVLQCGDPTGQGTGNPGYGFGIENAPKDGKYPTGTLAMARGQAADSNGGQFFIVYKPTELPTDGGGYSIFGKVIKGMDIIQRIAAAGSQPSQILPQTTIPTAPISILSISVTEKKA